MKESTAWRHIAKRLDAGKGSRFICIQIGQVVRDEGLRFKMRRLVDEHLGSHIFAYSMYPASSLGTILTSLAEHQPARVLACLMFAEVARDEERGVL